MKCSESWLREWVNPNLSREALCEMLTMSGLEVEEIAPVASVFTNIVIGKVLRVEKHPEADRLHVCDVDVGDKQLKIVCGADNVRENINVPVALIGTVLPGGLEIKKTKIRDVESNGMLCSATEIGMAEESKGLLLLPNDAPVGKDLREYLLLNDYTIEVSITPNRGDCLSVHGLAREISAITKTKIRAHEFSEIKADSSETLPVHIQHPAGCPRYVGRVIRGVDTTKASPIWLKEKLRRSGVRSINAVVDITNFVMLELGQPMHAFDLQMIDTEINVRLSKNGETIKLLDGTEKILDAETLLIADKNNPLAIAGVMGGLDSGVTLQTHDIFLESAYFSPTTVAKQRQTYLLNSDSAYRFERGVDPAIQRQAIERATQLVSEICGGKAGPIIESINQKHMPSVSAIDLQLTQVESVLGVAISATIIEEIFSLLGFTFDVVKGGWIVHAPSSRSDLVIAEDIIEEIARIYGYDKIPTHSIRAEMQIDQTRDNGHALSKMRDALRNQGYQEIISYSFIDKQLHQLFNENEEFVELLNPISSEMAVMRTSLVPGLVSTMLYNQSRQQQRIRLFEIGTCFVKAQELLQQPRIAGVIIGSLNPDQWGVPAKNVDFFDLKSDVTNLLKTFCDSLDLTFRPEQQSFLHPGQTAAIYYKNIKIGMIGRLHPSIEQALDLSKSAYVFELILENLGLKANYLAQEISKFPEIRRDLAILVNQTIPSKEIQDTIRTVAGDWLKDVFIFDVYQGKGILPGLKSVALGLILQDSSRTLIDEEVAELMARIVRALTEQLGAELRS